MIDTRNDSIPAAPIAGIAIALATVALAAGLAFANAAHKSDLPEPAPQEQPAEPEPEKQEPSDAQDAAEGDSEKGDAGKEKTPEPEEPARRDAVQDALEDMGALKMPEGLPDGVKEIEVRRAIAEHLKRAGVLGVASCEVSGPEGAGIDDVAHGGTMTWNYDIVSEGGGRYSFVLAVNDELRVTAYEVVRAPEETETAPEEQPSPEEGGKDAGAQEEAQPSPSEYVLGESAYEQIAQAVDEALEGSSWDAPQGELRIAEETYENRILGVDLEDDAGFYAHVDFDAAANEFTVSFA